MHDVPDTRGAWHAYPARTRHVGRPRGAHTERVLRGSKCAAFFPSPCYGFLPFFYLGICM